MSHIYHVFVCTCLHETLRTQDYTILTSIGHFYNLQWMLKLGLVRQSCPGVYHLLPLGLRSLEKLVALIDGEMKAIGAAKMAMPILTPATLWRKTGVHLKICLQMYASPKMHM